MSNQKWVVDETSAVMNRPGDETSGWWNVRVMKRPDNETSDDELSVMNRPLMKRPHTIIICHSD